jgi:hypothetical protein
MFYVLILMGGKLMLNFNMIPKKSNLNCNVVMGCHLLKIRKEGNLLPILRSKPILSDPKEQFTKVLNI